MTAEAEIAQPIDDVFAVIQLNAAVNMRMRAEYEIRTRIYEEPPEPALILQRLVHLFLAPVNRNDHEVALFARRTHRRLQFVVRIIPFGKAQRGNRLSLNFGRIFIAEAARADAVILQKRCRIGKPLLAVIQRMIIRDIARLNA